MPSPPALLHVRWQDHHTFHENQWRFPADFEDVKPQIIESVGWLIKETDDVLVIAAHRCSSEDNGAMTGEMCIVKRCILKRRKIKQWK